jgi:hypothetical protein
MQSNKAIIQLEKSQYSAGEQVNGMVHMDIQAGDE